MERAAYEHVTSEKTLGGKTLAQWQLEVSEAERRSIEVQRAMLVNSAFEVLKNMTTDSDTKQEERPVISDARIRMLTDSFISAMQTDLNARQDHFENLMASIVKATMRLFQADFSTEMEKMYNRQKQVMTGLVEKLEKMVSTFTGVLNTVNLKVQHLDQTVNSLALEVSKIRIQALQAGHGSQRAPRDLDELESDSSDEEMRKATESPRFGSFRTTREDIGMLLSQSAEKRKNKNQ